MNRVEAIRDILDRHPRAAFVFSNGLVSREASRLAHRAGSFYMLHAMGEGLSVGAGLKLARPELEVVVVEGDGNALMGLASLSLLPLPGLHHYVLDNRGYETTGGQAVPSLPFTVPGCTWIEIEPGTAGAPLPPSPEEILAGFREWLDGRAGAE